MKRKRYIIPATTVDRLETTVGIEVRCVSMFKQWLRDLRSGTIVSPFRFCWTERPGATEYYSLFGSFCPEHKRDGIYVVVNLRLEDYYTNMGYPLAEFCRMISEDIRPGLGWCITVKV